MDGREISIKLLSWRKMLSLENPKNTTGEKGEILWKSLDKWIRISTTKRKRYHERQVFNT